jgi:nitrite reductase/ring-hydroxylating ferredoxin subunit
MRVAVGLLEDLPRNRCVAIADDRAIVVRVGDHVMSFENRCLHQDSPLAGGVVDNGKLICPLHFWRYEAATGRHVGGQSMLPTYDVQIEGGEVYVELPDPEPKLSMRDMMLRHAQEWSRE